MAMAFIASKQRPAGTSAGTLARLRKRVLAGLLSHCRAPDPGVKPPGLHVSSRGWKRNSAYLMSLYESQRQ
jgi:hypothetical protein